LRPRVPAQFLIINDASAFQSSDPHGGQHLPTGDAPADKLVPC
jgi:hypothetical protein